MKNLVLSLVFACSAYTVSAVTMTWKENHADNDWTKGSNYKNGVAPGAGDTVEIPNGVTVTLDGTSSSFPLAASLNQISLLGASAYLDITVPSGDATMNCAIKGKYAGHVRKYGAGSLRFGKNGTADYNYTSIHVYEGALWLQQGASGTCYFDTIAISRGATVYGAKTQRTSVKTITGEGEYTTIDNAEILPTGGTDAEPIACAVHFSNCRMYLGGKYRFAPMTATSNEFGSFYLYNGSTASAASFGSTTVGSPLGTCDIRFAEGGGGTVKYNGTTAATCDRGFTILAGYGGIDGGPSGGLTLTGTWWLGNWYGDMGQITLSGNHINECVFGGDVKNNSGITAECSYFYKTGSGTWRLAGGRDRSTMFSATFVEEGRLRFDSVFDKGQDCALGTAANPIEPYHQGGYDSARAVDYAVRLGKPGIAYPAANLATFQYCGSSPRCITTRPIALYGDAAFESSETKIVWSGISPVSEGLTKLVLKGGYSNGSTVADVTDGKQVTMKLGVVKDGDGTWTLTGRGTFSGPLIVNRGTLIARRQPASYTWYRLVIRDGYLGPGYDYFKIGRIGFMDEAGVRQNCDMTYVSNYTDESMSAYRHEYYSGVLEPGQFGWGARHSVGTREGSKMTDIVKAGRCSDDSCHNFARSGVKASYLNDPAKWLYYDFRMPENARQVCYYDMAVVYGAANGSYAGYMFKAWSLMGSTDGIHWRELHRVEDARSIDAAQKLKQRNTANSWMGNQTPSDQYPVAAGDAFDITKIQPIATGIDETDRLPFLNNVEYISVAPGATLQVEGGTELSRFKVDASGEGVGLVAGAKLAENCTIDITNLPNGYSGDLPLRFEGVTGRHVWKCRVNGVEDDSKEVFLANGRLRIEAASFCVIVE